MAPRPTTPGKLSEQIRAFARKVDRRVVVYIQTFTHLMGTELVMGSPVGDPSRWAAPPDPGYVGGHFRGNWRVSLSGQESGTLARIDPDGLDTIASMDTAVAGVRPGARVTFFNNLPYARRIEYGWSNQAPAGVVRLAMARAQNLSQQAAATARKLVP